MKFAGLNPWAASWALTFSTASWRQSATTKNENALPVGSLWPLPGSGSVRAGVRNKRRFLAPADAMLPQIEIAFKDGGKIGGKFRHSLAGGVRPVRCSDEFDCHRFWFWFWFWFWLARGSDPRRGCFFVATQTGFGLGNTSRIPKSSVSLHGFGSTSSFAIL